MGWREREGQRERRFQILDLVSIEIENELQGPKYRPNR
jgi:hypothetical protein